MGSQLPFDRLVRAVETWARAAGRTDVVFQVGDGGHRPDGFEAVERLEPDAFDAAVSEAELVVGHAGTGTIMAALEAGRPVVCLARREALGETRNDHQVATLERFRTRDGVTGTADEADLPARIDDALRAGPPAEALGPFARGPLVDRLRSFLEEYVQRPGGDR
ncbi:MAG: glycosyltransferase [Planctomycetota bacterium]